MLGRGGQAEVMPATHRLSKERVALKRLNNRDADSLARMRREIQAQNDLRHHNIMPIKDYDRAEFSWYTMPVADAVLGDLKPSQFSKTFIIGVVRACCYALGHAHGQGYIHRDITPRNIFRLTTGDRKSWVVGDWGCVRRPLGMTTVVRSRPGEFAGTAGYAPPEMWDDPHAVDMRGDVYSLGRVVAWACTGKSPIPNRELLPVNEWREFVLRATKDDPAERVQDVDALIRLIPPLASSGASVEGVFDLMDPETELVWVRRVDVPTLAFRNKEREVVLSSPEVGYILPYIYAAKNNHKKTGFLRVNEVISWGKLFWSDFPSAVQSKDIIGARKFLMKRMREAGVINAQNLFVGRTGMAPATVLNMASAKIIVID
jgi:serine/threonine protein kinase